MNVPKKITFTQRHSAMSAGLVGRSNRRRFVKLSRLGKLTDQMVGPFAMYVIGRINAS